MTVALAPDFTGTSALSFTLGDPNNAANYIASGATVATANVLTTDTVINVSSITPFGGAGMTIQIDAEYMLVTSVGSSTLTVTRGQGNTAAAAHSIGAVINISQVQMWFNNAGVMEARDASGSFLTSIRAKLIGGTIDGVVIGGTTPTAGTFTSLSVGGTSLDINLTSAIGHIQSNSGSNPLDFDANPIYLNAITNNPINTGTGLFTAGGAFTSTGDATLGGKLIHTGASITFFNGGPAVAQQAGHAWTNNIASGGTNDQADNWTSLTTYSTDAAAIRNACYQMAREIGVINGALRAYHLLS